MRKPKVENKYNLKFSDLQKLKCNTTKPPTFWRNTVINAWCFNETSIMSKADREYGNYDEYSIIARDNGKVEVVCASYGSKSCWFTLCGYNFEDFFSPDSMENIHDLVIQEKLMTKINSLIDDGIFSKEDI